MIRPDPPPCSLMLLPETVTPEVQEHEPAGMITRSPVDAVSIAVCTLAGRQLVAVIVAASAAATLPSQTVIRIPDSRIVVHLSRTCTNDAPAPAAGASRGGGGY